MGRDRKLASGAVSTCSKDWQPLHWKTSESNIFANFYFEY
jgi:hypothetical protein